MSARRLISSSALVVVLAGVFAAALMSLGTPEVEATPVPKIITGAGAGGGSHVSGFDQSGSPSNPSFFAYPGFTGGVRVAVGDVTGDGTADYITAPGSGGGPHIRVFDGATNGQIHSFFAYDSSFSGGVFVAAGDVNGDGYDDVITGPGASGGPHVKVFDLRNNQTIKSFFAYNSGFTGGVFVAAGDVNGDGYDDVITGPGAGGGPHVQVFSGPSPQGTGVLRSYFEYGSFSGGVRVASGDVNGDFYDDIVTAPGPGGGPHVVSRSGLDQSVIKSFFAYSSSFTGGVFVASGYINGDDNAEIITAPGAGGGPHVLAFDGATNAMLLSFMAYGERFTGGVFVAVGDFDRKPVVNGDSYSMSENTVLNVPAPGVLANDGDPDGHPLYAQLLENVSNGTLTLNPDGSFTYTPLPNFFGTDDFVYMAHNGDFDGSVASVSIEVSNDSTSPGVTINQASGQADPTNSSPINFTVVFSEIVTGFTSSDVTLGGTANPVVATVTGSGSSYNVAVSGMNTTGTVTASVPAGSANDASGNGNTASTSTDNQVTYDATSPTVRINQASSQADPTNASPVNFTVLFSEPVTGFTASDLNLGGTANPATATVTGDGASYNVAVSGMNTTGTVTASIPPSASTDSASNGNAASTSTDNQVTYDPASPSVTINQASGQNDPTNSSPINFTVLFSEPVTGFNSSDVTLGGTALPTSAIITGASPGATYNVAVSGMSLTGTVSATVNTGAATDAAGNSSAASTSTDNLVTYDATGPDVTINQASGQADPTSSSPINFTVVFGEIVTGFTSSDVTLGGTANATTADVTGSGTTYNVAVSGMNTTGTVTASVPAGAANDASGNANTASTSTDNQVTYDATRPDVTINQASGQSDPTNTSPINFTVLFSEPVTGFTASDLNLAGSGNPATATVTGDGATYNVAVSGMTVTGTVTASVPAGSAKDSAGNPSAASTSTDNQVTYDATGPTVTINQFTSQPDPTRFTPINFTVTFTEPVTGFTATDVTLGGTANPTTAEITGSGSSYNVAVSGMSVTGTVTATVNTAAANDAAGNSSAASTSTDNVVTYDATGPTASIAKAAAQPDPTNSDPINFTVTFSEPVTGFTSSDVTLGGTAGATSAAVSGSESTYNVAVSGMSTTGTVTATINTAAANDAATNPSSASNTAQVNYDPRGPTVTINQATGQADPTNSSPINFTVVFSEPVTGLTGSGITVGGTANPTTASVSGSGANYTVGVSGMSVTGTVTATVNAGGANDAAGNGNAASTSTDNQVRWDQTGPTYLSVSGTSGTKNLKALFSENILCSSASKSDFLVTVNGGPQPIGSITCSGTLDPEIDLVINMASNLAGGDVVALQLASPVSDEAGNNAATPTTRITTIDADRPGTTISKATSQSDPANSSPINFTVTFTEPVTGFTSTDVTLGGSANPVSSTVSGSGANYNVAVFGMNTTGTVTAAVVDAAAADPSGNLSTASGTAQVNYDPTGPNVTINQATGQADPTNASPINYTVSFTEPVSGLTGSDITLGGTANPTTATVTSSGATTYNVAVSGMTTTGTVTASIPAGSANDTAGNGNFASTSTDNQVSYDATGPQVTINQASTQPDPTNASPVTFTAVFSEPVIGFTASDVTLGGTAGANSAVVNGSGTTYSVSVSGMTSTGTVTASIPAGSANDTVGNTNFASTSTDNQVTYDATGPGVTVSKASGQNDPTNSSPINFTVTFSEPVTGFTSTDVVLEGTANPVTATVTGSETTYNVAVSGMNQGGTVSVRVPAVSASDVAGNTNTASNTALVNYDPKGPTVTINQASGQTDPTNSSPINFTVLFDESVTGFTASDVTIRGTAGANSVVVSGGPATYNVAVSGMSVTGTVTATVNAGAVTDSLGNPSSPSTSDDNEVIFDAARPSLTINQSSGQTDPTRSSPINFTAVFSESVTGFTSSDVLVTGTAGATSAVVTGSGNTYNVAVSPTASGSVFVSVPENVAIDAAGNANFASTSTDNFVTYDVTLPVFNTVSATGGSSTVTATFSEPILCTTVSTTDFLATVNNLTAIVTAVNCEGSADDTIALTLSAAPAGGQSVAINLVGPVTDRAGNTAASVERTGVASNQIPLINVTGGPSEGAFSNDNTPNYSGDASDPDGTISGIQVSLDGGPFSSAGTSCPTCPSSPVAWTFSATGTVADGSHQYVFKSVDNAGAFSSTVTRTVIVDTKLPVFLSISAVGGNPVVTATFDEPLLCSTVDTVANEDFLASVAGLPVAITSTTCSGTSDSTIELTLATAPSSGDTVSIQLAGVVTDRAGNAASEPAPKTTTAT